MTNPAQPNPLLLAPFSQEAEEATIGGVLISPQMYSACAKIISAGDFYLTRNRSIWQALTDLHEAEEIVDLTMISEKLRTMGVLEEIGGYAYLVHLLGIAPNSMHAPAYAELVARTAKRRLLLSVADKMRAWAMDETLNYGEVFSRSQAALDAARPTDRTKHLQGAVSVEVYHDLIIQRDVDRMSGKKLLVPLPKRWTSMKNKMHALRLDDLVVLGGPSGSGKSAMGECLAECCAEDGDLVSYVHTEMSHENLMDRRMARHSGLLYHQLLTGDVTDDIRGELLLEGRKRIEQFASNISYDWMPNVSFSDLAGHWRDQYDAGFRRFFLDHFQDVTFPRDTRSGASNPVEDYARLAAWLAAFVEKRGDATVFVMSQLNKEGDIKGGLKLFEKATVVLTFSRPSLANTFNYTYGHDSEVQLNPGEDSPVADIRIDKHRFGAKGKFRMFYHGLRFSWVDLLDVNMPSLPITTGRVTPMPEQNRQAR
jgi:replicative DNA helicase